MKTDGDLRMLGASDGLSHALIWVRGHIERIDGRYSPGIHPRHIKKRAARDSILRPLRELEARLAGSHAATLAAYDATRKEIA